LELKLNEQQKIIDLFKGENETTSLKISQLELELVDLNKVLENEKASLKAELNKKEKHYDGFIEELNEKHKIECERLKSSNVGNGVMISELSNVKQSNQDLRKQLEELKYSYDELKDEKEQILSSLNELKQNRHDSNETMRYKHQIKLNEKKILDLEEKLMNLSQVKVNNNTNMVRSQEIINSHSNTRTSSTSASLEPTEIDYLKKIVYSYMMGTDSITMAKVIIAILKFDEDEKAQIIEHEKAKNAAWKFPVLQ